MSGGQCHLTIRRRFSWPYLACVHRSGLKPDSFHFHPFIHSFMKKLFHSPIHLFIHPSFTHRFTHPSIYSFIHQFTHRLTHPSIYSLIHSNTLIKWLYLVRLVSWHSHWFLDTPLRTIRITVYPTTGWPSGLWIRRAGWVRLPPTRWLSTGPARPGRQVRLAGPTP